MALLLFFLDIPVECKKKKKPPFLVIEVYNVLDWNLVFPHGYSFVNDSAFFSSVAAKISNFVFFSTSFSPLAMSL